MTGSIFSSAIALVYVDWWSIATSSPPRMAPSLTVCSVLGRWPMPVNIRGRVRISFTGRPTVRAASTARIVCDRTRSPAPNPPPTYGASTRTADGSSSRGRVAVGRGSPAQLLLTTADRTKRKPQVIPMQDHPDRLGRRPQGVLLSPVARRGHAIGGRKRSRRRPTPRVSQPAPGRRCVDSSRSTPMTSAALGRRGPGRRPSPSLPEQKHVRGRAVIWCIAAYNPTSGSARLDVGEISHDDLYSRPRARPRSCTRSACSGLPSAFLTETSDEGITSGYSLEGCGTVTNQSRSARAPQEV